MLKRVVRGPGCGQVDIPERTRLTFARVSWSRKKCVFVAEL